ncbi:MAG TPA: aminotransferase class IV [Cyclobacteriaceae bacterium]|nr:aminotransferase class IV [Cyclobacteriaceae bacterium]
MTKPFCFSGDKVIPSSAASLHPLDIGLIRGYAIFDFLRTVNYKPLFLDAYLDRFITSAESMYLPLSLSRRELEAVIQQLIERNDLSQGGLRLVLTGGVSNNCFSPTKGNLFIFAEELKMPAAEKYENGVKLLSEEYVRPLASVKSTNYTLPVWLSAGWQEQAAEDLIYHFNGIISESSRSNIFMVKNGEIATPKSNILLGVTRKNVIKLAETVQERDITLTEILNADEVFMTATTKKILPVTQIDGTLIKNGRPGPVTLSLLEKFKQLELQQTS